MSKKGGMVPNGGSQRCKSPRKLCGLGGLGTERIAPGTSKKRPEERGSTRHEGGAGGGQKPPLCMGTGRERGELEWEASGQDTWLLPWIKKTKIWEKNAEEEEEGNEERAEYSCEKARPMVWENRTGNRSRH